VAEARPDHRPNLLVIVSDEHDAAVTGCYGHPTVKTPHLDRLAQGGTVFERAYCTSPICVPSRLSFLTGRYPHDVGAWDNGSALDSRVPTWGHFLGRAGYETVICGRTHFNGADRLHGFDRRLSDDLPSWYSTGPRAPSRTADARRTRPHVAITRASEDESDAYMLRHDTHDATVAALCRDFLTQKAAAPRDRPWLLYCGLIHPHFPLVAPRAYLDLYDPSTVRLPPTWDEALAAQHPAIQQLRRGLANDVPLTDEAVRRAMAAYWALVTLVDERIGTILECLDGSPLRENTVVLYTSDHGDTAGHHGLWQKHCFYEPAVRVPLLLRLPPSLRANRGPGGGLPPRVEGNVSLLDLLPTLLELADQPIPTHLPGRSLLSVASSATTGADAARPVFAELHSEGTLSAAYMVKRGAFKYCHYVGSRPQLFNTQDDPLERDDLSANPAYAGTVADLHSELLRTVDPEQIDARAKADQSRRQQDQSSASAADRGAAP
jgi:choline-sulfatase